LSRFLTGVRNC